MDAGGVSSPVHIPGLCRVLLDAPLANTNRETLWLRLTRADLARVGCAWRRRDQLEFFSCFRQSCLASAVPWAGRNRPLALGLCAPMVPRDGPPSPASCASGDAAIPRIAVAAIPRGNAGGGRHPPGQRRSPPSTRREAHSFRPPARAESGRSTTSTAAAADHDASASGRARRGYQRDAATWGLLGTGAAVYGPERIAAPALSGPSPSRGEAALVSVDRAAA
jgi:hypothetical protein